MYVEVFKDMKSGILLVLSGYVTNSLALIALAFYSILVFESLEIDPTHPGLRSPLISTLVVSGVCLGLVFYGLFLKFLPGVERLSGLDTQYTKALKLLKIGYYPSIFLIVLDYMITTVVIVYEPEAPLPDLLVQLMHALWVFYVLSDLFAAIAIAGHVVLCRILGSREGIVQYRTAGKLFILALILMVVSVLIDVVRVLFDVVLVLAWIFLYKALGASIRKHSHWIKIEQWTTRFLGTS